MLMSIVLSYFFIIESHGLTNPLIGFQITSLDTSEGLNIKELASKRSLLNFEYKNLDISDLFWPFTEIKDFQMSSLM